MQKIIESPLQLVHCGFNTCNILVIPPPDNPERDVEREEYLDKLLDSYSDDMIEDELEAALNEDDDIAHEIQLEYKAYFDEEDDETYILILTLEVSPLEGYGGYTILLSLFAYFDLGEGWGKTVISSKPKVINQLEMNALAIAYAEARAILRNQTTYALFGRLELPLMNIEEMQKRARRYA